MTHEFCSLRINQPPVRVNRIPWRQGTYLIAAEKLTRNYTYPLVKTQALD
ncbi:MULTISPECIES: hypothetical protein [Arsenophonus]|uniref:Uncharacterized protein n=1 Tax=Arsenophonus apicola TaxID=2879119 RepID=A0ABY8P2P2_9GAMM|nr:MULTISPECIES: hypothetical protein [Arsenophonus]UBX29348.1 hypothetical protein LDL57_01200 [Arsenophonus apicola]WGO83775.1 hypothetical protein QG404_02315 [Arsenophonus apicola]